MKLLVAVESKDFAEHIVDYALRIVGRTGYSFKLFVPAEQDEAYLQAIEEANYHYYLTMDNDTIVTGQDPKDYAKSNGFDLIVFVPHDIKPYDKRKTKKDLDADIPMFVIDVGKARSKFSKSSTRQRIRLKNGVVMERVHGRE